MLSLNNLKPTIGSKKSKKRVGRGNGSGKGTYCGRGLNGQNSRSGGGVAPWFEGGQTPLFRRMPKLKGFSNAFFKKHYSIINVSDLDVLFKKGITDINKQVLLDNGIINNKNFPIKVLGDGEITGKISLKVDKISKTAEEKIKKLSGEIIQ